MAGQLLRGVAERLLMSTGRSYEIDPRISAGSIFGELVLRAVQLVRGVVRGYGPVFLGARVKIRGRASFAPSRGISIGDYSAIDARGSVGVRLGPGSRLGKFGIITTTSHLSLAGVGVVLGSGSGIGDYFHIGASGGVTFGSNVIVGPRLLVHSQEHNYADPTRPIREQGTTQAAVTVGDDCWLGSGVTLLAGTTLGPRTIVAAGSVVKGTHPGGVILAGTPAKVVKEI